MENLKGIARTLACGVAYLALTVPAAYAAAESSEKGADAAPAAEDSRIGSDEIVVTATKSRQGTTVQNAALTLSAFGEAQLEAAHASTLNEIAKMMPNVHLEGGAFSTGNNYSIRGMGLYTKAR